MKLSKRARMVDYRKVEKQTYNGMVFDSKKELRRYQELELLQRAGAIVGLQRQVEYVLIPPFVLGTKKYRPTKYIADFAYMENGKIVVEDAKGFKTDKYRLKAKLMAFFKNIEVREV